jgi:hypothetical protein
MKPPVFSALTICGLDELDYYSSRGVTHVLSILDPEWPEPAAFWAFDPHFRATLHFHDAIDPAPEIVLPQVADVEAILTSAATWAAMSATCSSIATRGSAARPRR